MPAQSTEVFTITFQLEPGVNTLRATLPNGASFLVESHEVHGKLGQNLDLLRQALKPKSTDFNIKAVAQGRAEGISASYDKAQKAKAKAEEARRIQDALDNMEITL